MNRVVYTESHSNDNINHREEVDVNVPEIQESHGVNQGEDDTGENHETDGEVGVEEECDEEHTTKRHSDVAPDLRGN